MEHTGLSTNCKSVGNWVISLVYLRLQALLFLSLNHLFELLVLSGILRDWEIHESPALAVSFPIPSFPEPAGSSCCLPAAGQEEPLRLTASVLSSGCLMMRGAFGVLIPLLRRAQCQTPHRRLSQRLEPARCRPAGLFAPNPLFLRSPGGPGGPLPGRPAAAARLGAVPDGALPAAPTPAVALSPAGPGCPVRRPGGDTSAGLGTALRGKPAALPWRGSLAAAGQCWVAEEGVKEPGGHADTFFGI